MSAVANLAPRPNKAMQPLTFSHQRFVPNVQFSRKIGRESAFLLGSLAALILAACSCALVAHRRDEISADFVRHARIALLETTLDRFTWNKPTPNDPNVTSTQVRFSVTHANAFIAAEHLPSPSLAALAAAPSGTPRAASAPGTVAVASQPNWQRSHRPWEKPGPAAVATPSSAVTLGANGLGANGISANGVVASADAAPRQHAQQPTMPASANAPAIASNAPSKAASMSKGVEAVSRSKAMISTIDHDGVTLSNGHKIGVGTLFSTGERLLSVDPANDQFTTDKRTIVLF